VKHVLTIFKRELSGYFLTPVAYIFIVFFLLLINTLTFWYGGFY
jgi:ABC-2 type transport system permease protein